MATAFRSVSAPSATTLTSVHTFTTAGTCNVSIVNRGSANITVRVAVIDGAPGAVANEDYIEYGATVVAGGVLERSGIVCEAAEQVCVYASTGDASVRVHGWEE